MRTAAAGLPRSTGERDRTWRWIGAAAVAALVTGFAWQRWATAPDDADPGRPPASPAAAVVPGSVPVAGALFGAAGAGGVAAGVAPAASDPVSRLWTEGSLRGTLPDGDWGRWVDGRLQPSFSLRQRFDHLLSAQGEVTIDELRRWVSAQVTAAHGAAGAAQVLDLWDRYLQVQSARYALEANPADPTTWQPALAEHSRVRRELLGSAWAEAFYGAEERALAADTARRQSLPGSATSAGTSPQSVDALLAPATVGGTGTAVAPLLQAARAARFGAEAADRLKANDAAWQAWQQRIDAARAGRSAIDNDPSLSPPQRDDAKARLLNDGFSPAERIRARGLIDAAPSTGAAP